MWWCMMKNRSVPADIVLPNITYQNVADALMWLTKAFGFPEHYRYGEPGGRVDAGARHEHHAKKGLAINDHVSPRGAPAPTNQTPDSAWPCPTPRERAGSLAALASALIWLISSLRTCSARPLST
jgi:hypothetical protein